MPVTIWQAAEARGAQKDEHGYVSGAEFVRVGLPMWGGCERCYATIACYNAYPSTTGYLRCGDCIYDEIGFATVAAFEEWCERDADELAGAL
jgi:hypothetical protein